MKQSTGDPQGNNVDGVNHSNHGDGTTGVRSQTKLKRKDSYEEAVDAGSALECLEAECGDLGHGRRLEADPKQGSVGGCQYKRNGEPLPVRLCICYHSTKCSKSKL